MTGDSEDLGKNFIEILDEHFMGPIDEPQDGMTFQPGDRVRITEATGAILGSSWVGLLCEVVKSRKSPEGTDEMCVLIPLEPRPDNKSMGEDQWFLWEAVYLSRA